MGKCAKIFIEHLIVIIYHHDYGCLSGYLTAHWLTGADLLQPCHSNFYFHI